MRRRPSSPLLRALRGLRALVLCALCACGDGAASSTAACTPPPSASPPPAPSALAGRVSLAAGSALVPRGGSVDLVAGVAGPGAVDAPCDGPVALTVSTPSGIHVLSDTPAVSPGDPCGHLDLTAGHSAAFHLRWDVDPTLPSGRYTVTAEVGDLPEVSVEVEVAGGVEGAPPC